MRVLYCVFLLIAVFIAFLLLTQSHLLFAVYVGAAPIVLFLTWYLRNYQLPTKEAKDPKQESGSGTASTSTVVDASERQPNTRITAESISGRRLLIRQFWNWTVLVFLTPILCLTIISVIQRLRDVPDYVWFVVPLLVLVTWVVLVSSLASISRILLFKRNETNFPKWSTLFGVVSTFALALCALSPLSVVLILPGGCGSGVPHPIPPNAFKVNQTIRLALGGAETKPMSERYEIEPRSNFAIAGVQEIKSGKIAEANIENLERFESGKFENIPLEAMHLDLRRQVASQTQNMGLLRSKVTLSLPVITLIAQDLKKPVLSSSTPANDYAAAGEFPVSRASDYHANVEIEMPKDSFLAASPKAEFTSLPDKDVLTFSFSKAPREVEVYYLRHARLKVVREFLSQSSNHDVAVSLLAFLFWPVTMIMISVFHKTLADRILGFLTSRFKKKPERVVGFGTPTK